MRHAQRPTTGPGRSSAWVVALATAGLLGAACRDIVTDDVVDAQGALCDRLRACDLEGCREVTRFFETSEGKEVDAYLREFAAQGCDQGCGAAPLCIDIPPICVDIGQPCDVDSPYFCCDATKGSTTCKADVEGGDGRCCKGPGLPCEESAECCALDDGQRLRCEEAPSAARGQTTCGGVPACIPFEEACSENAECCSRSCVDGLCDRISCVPTGGSCGGGDVCCSAAEVCGEGGVCAPPPRCTGEPNEPADCPCVDNGDPCDMAMPWSCCSDQCMVTLAGDAFCGEEGCFPIGADCASDDQCQCGGERPDGACLEIASGDGGSQRACFELGCESDASESCAADRPCCAGLSCVIDPGDDEGTCLRQCSATECEGRSPQSFGTAITPTEELAGDEDAACLAAAACASAICEFDDYCCCFTWDPVCVGHAKDLAASGDTNCEP